MHGVQELMHLDRLKVVEAEAVRGRRKESGIAWMGTVDQHAVEALLAGGPARAVDLQLVGALAAEGDAALRAGEIEADVHLAAMGDAARLDGADGAARERHGHGRPVLVLYSPALAPAWLERARLVSRPGEAADAADGAAERPGDRDDVPAEV